MDRTSASGQAGEDSSYNFSLILTLNSKYPGDFSAFWYKKVGLFRGSLFKLHAFHIHDPAP